MNALLASAVATPRPLTLLGDVLRLCVRAVRRDVRSIDALIVSIALPITMLALFVYVFGGAITTGATGLAYVDFVVPTVILIAGGYGAALTAVNIAEDVNSGMIDRLRSLPINDTVVPLSHIAAATIRTSATTALTIAVAIAFGFQPHATVIEWVAAAGLICGYLVAVASIAALWGLIVSSPQAAGAFGFVVLFLPYLSAGVVPPETMPAAIRSFAEHQPFTPIVDTLRALLLDETNPGAQWTSVVWIAAAITLALPATAHRFRQQRR